MSATKFVMVGLLALCMLSIAAPVVSAATSDQAQFTLVALRCTIKIAYIAGHDVVVDGQTIVRTSGRWVCV